MKVQTTINLFATKQDWISIFKFIEEVDSLIYCSADQDRSSFVKAKNIHSIPELGISKNGDPAKDKIWLVGHESWTPKLREVNGIDNAKFIHFDQLKNEESVVVKFGGIFEKEQILIAGQIGTISTNENSLTLFNKIKKEVLNKFTKIKSYNVGPEAEKLLSNNWRLTSSSKSPREYDLIK